MLAAIKGKPFPCGRMSLAAFDINTYSYDGTVLAAFQVNSLPLWQDGVCGLRLTPLLAGQHWNI